MATAVKTRSLTKAADEVEGVTKVLAGVRASLSGLEATSPKLEAKGAEVVELAAGVSRSYRRMLAK